ncbi:phosphoribosylamine--glycine ligase [Carnimonas nigrificans]|uniref:phosphoribosylamine--glycine ligase n=1 Tax=Carnimonas nigrificans TaxID=64323 RepID=UPI0004724EF0|nr:phosphoribosylamine--glycine ligase [Carnimonas nigrificans]
MNVLIIGNGGREHALAWKAAQSPRVSNVFVLPGNAGTAQDPALTNVALSMDDHDALVAFAREQQVALTIVGPEAPLVAGIVDLFQQHGLAIFGPTAAAAQLEGSKSFTKEFLARHAIPTADFQTFTRIDEALAYLDELSQQGRAAPIVIKADGLAAGKGVVVATTEQQARDAIRDMLEDNAFGDAGARVVIEEFLDGEEASFICMVDGTHILPMATSQDHKRALNGDKGPNTGGMGAYSPAPVVTPEVEQRILREVIEPTVSGMAQEGAPFCGFLYAGLMIDTEGAPKVIEYNVRFGDPETQPIMLRLDSDLVELVQAAVEGRLDRVECAWNEQPAVGVVVAAGGYPGSYRKGDPISGIEAAEQTGCKVFQAGTALANDQLVSAGGRVLCVTALGDTVAEAAANAYRGVEQINLEGAEFRTDIAHRAIAREQH